MDEKKNEDHFWGSKDIQIKRSVFVQKFRE